MSRVPKLNSAVWIASDDRGYDSYYNFMKGVKKQVCMYHVTMVTICFFEKCILQSVCCGSSILEPVFGPYKLK